CERAIEKQEASAAAMSSSGLEPAEASSARALQVSGRSLTAPLPVETVPFPLIRSPFQVADAVCSTAMLVPSLRHRPDQRDGNDAAASRETVPQPSDRDTRAPGRSI